MSHPKVRPLGDKVLVKREQAAETRGGIMLPDSAKEKPKVGEVIAVGPGRMEDDGTVTPVNVKKGDQVLFGSYAGVELQSDDNYLLLSEDEILAQVE